MQLFYGFSSNQKISNQMFIYVLPCLWKAAQLSKNVWQSKHVNLSMLSHDCRFYVFVPATRPRKELHLSLFGSIWSSENHSSRNSHPPFDCEAAWVRVVESTHLLGLGPMQQQHSRTNSVSWKVKKKGFCNSFHRAHVLRFLRRWTDGRKTAEGLIQ